MDRRRALLSSKKESKWYISLQPNSNVQAVIDGHDIFLSYFPNSGTVRQIKIVFKETVILQAGDTIGVKYSQIGSVRPTGYCELAFWSKTPTGSYSARYLNANFAFNAQLNTIIQYTATETIMGSVIYMQARASVQTYSTPLHLHFEVFINGNSIP